MAVDDLFVIDAVSHGYNLDKSNFASVKQATPLAELAWNLASTVEDPRYALPRDAYMTDWSVDDAAAMLFHESDTDVSVMHPLPMYAYKDGLSSIEKAAEAVQNYPNRFIGAYACIDPLQGARAMESLEQQVELLKPMGLKLYPTSWDGDTATNWRMDDPEVAFPTFEKARDLGINHIAIHKAVPSGLVPIGDAYGAKDVEGAAYAFPDLTFEIVHGGLAFVEETSIVMARHANVWINLEIWTIVLQRRPRVFAQMLAALLNDGGMPVLDRVIWGQGATLVHPRPGLEAFVEFEFPDDVLASAGMFGALEQLTKGHKAKILAGNYARLHGLDLEAIKSAIAGDEFSRAPGDLPAEPFSKTSKSQIAA
jgi:predicted TIM-barrel fold metal-dependent hydrolase